MFIGYCTVKLTIKCYHINVTESFRREEGVHVQKYWKFLGGWGVTKDSLGMEIPEGWGGGKLMKTKMSSGGGGYGYFLEPHIVKGDMRYSIHKLKDKKVGVLTISEIRVLTFQALDPKCQRETYKLLL